MTPPVSRRAKRSTRRRVPGGRDTVGDTLGAEASYRWIDSEPSRADVGGRAGLVPFARRANAQGVVELEVQLDGWTDAELGLAAGWVR